MFLLYTAVAGNSTPLLLPSQLAAHPGKVAVEGAVVGPVQGDSHAAGGLRFGIRDVGGKGPVVAVVYRGDSPPPLFAVGRRVVVNGTYTRGRLAGNGIVTKCPSKYAPTKTP